MQTEQTQNELIIRESPGCLWIVGLLFALVGGAFVYGALGGLIDYQRHAPWLLALSMIMGICGVAAGVWIIYGAPMTKVIIDRIEDTVWMTRYGLLGKSEIAYRFDEIRQFCLVEEKDDEGNPIWSLGMELTNNETIKISSLPSHDEYFKRGFVFQANEFTRKQFPLSRMILESEDENALKII